jgi:murein biosynthesis integral membrane protein MurJ
MAVRLQPANKYIFRALLYLASAALLIRVMGMLNQIVVTAHFGLGASMDAYFVATTVPLLVADLVDSTVQASVIPAYARVHTQGGKKQASALFSTMLNILLAGAILLTAIMLLFHREMIFLSAPALDPLRAGLASSLVLFILPTFILTVVGGFMQSILNAEGQFGLPAYAGILVPLTTAIFVLAVGKSFGIVMLCIGMAAGLCLQLAVLILRIRRAGLTYRPTINLRNSGLSTLLTVAWPAFFSALIVRTSPLVDQIFASSLSAGSISALEYSLKLVSVPIGVIFASVGSAILPYLSRQTSSNDMNAFKETLRLYFWVVGIGATVLAAFMILLAHPIVQILFQRGAFTTDDTTRTATTLVGFLVGLTPIALSYITTKAFSALGKTKILMRISIFSVIANAIFDYIFARWWQSFGIALATSVVQFCAIAILFFTLQRMVGKLHLFTPPDEVVKVIEKLNIGRFYRYRVNGGEENPPSFSIPYSVRRQIVRVSIVVTVFAAGVAGVIQNSLYTLRVAFASIILLALLRYRYVLLLAWVLINALNGLPTFRGTNVLIGLTVPTLLLMACLPIKQTFKRLPALAFLFIYLLWVFASIGISDMGVGTFLSLWTQLLDCVAIGILTINVITTRRHLLGLIDAILLLSAFIALYGIYGYITTQNGVYDNASTPLFRIGSIFGDSPTTLSLFLSIVIPLSIYRASIFRGFKRAIGVLLVLALLMALGLTFTRAAYISVPLSIIFMIPFLPSRKMKIGMLSSFGVAAALIVLLLTVGDIPIFIRFFSPDLTTLNGRTYLWQAIFSHFDPTQLLGKGLYASDTLLTYLHVSINGHGVIDTSPHSLFLGTLYDHGIIGVILLALVFIALAVSIIRGMRKASGDHQALLAVALAILVSVLIQSLDSNNFWTQVFTIYFWIIIALPFALCWSTPKEPAKDSLDEDTLPRIEAIRRKEQEQLSHVVPGRGI